MIPVYADRAKIFAANNAKDISEVFGRPRAACHSPSAQTARGVPRFVPLAACAGRSLAAPRFYFPAFPGLSLRKFPKPPFAAARRESSTSCSPMPQVNWGIARRGSSLRLNADVVATGNPGMCVANANLHWRAMAGRFPWCTRFNSWMRPFVASQSNRCGVNPFLKNATRRECRFSGRCRATSLRTGKTRGTPFLRRTCFHLAFGIAGISGPLVPGAGLVARKTRI